MTDGLPPQDIDAEQSVLGCVMMSTTAADTVLELLEPADFYLQAHQQVCDAVIALRRDEVPVDLRTLPSLLEARGQLERIGGMAYLLTLSESVPTSAHAEYYAQIVRRKSLRRKALGAAERIVALAHGDQESDDETFGGKVAEVLEQAVAAREAGPGPLPVSHDCEQKLRRVEEQCEGTLVDRNVTTFASVDRVARPLRPSQLVVVAARPAMGKTSWALQLAMHAARTYGAERGPVVFFSLEMTREQVYDRLIAMSGPFHVSAVSDLSLRGEAWDRFMKVNGQLGDLPLEVDDSSDLTIREIRNRCRKIKRQRGGVSLVVIDYLQIMKAPRAENRNNELSILTREAKNLAKYLHCPVVLLSQLSREVEKRKPPRPMMSDVRDSGAIEAEADRVYLLYRPKYYEPDAMLEPFEPETSELIIGKNRNDPVGIAYQQFTREFAAFDLTDTRHDAPPPPHGDRRAGRDDQ